MKFRHTQTNVKRRDRQIATIIFAICELVVIFFFAYLGIYETRQITDEDTEVIVGEIEGRAHFDYGSGIGTRPRIHYYKLWIDGKKYRLNVSESDCDALEKILTSDSSPNFEFRVYSHPFSKEIVEFYHNGEELSTVSAFNDVQRSGRTAAILLFIFAEVVTIPLYVVYMVFHRTSKDKKWI